jgi:hypothetical protein
MVTGWTWVESAGEMEGDKMIREHYLNWVGWDKYGSKWFFGNELRVVPDLEILLAMFAKARGAKVCFTHSLGSA